MVGDRDHEAATEWLEAIIDFRRAFDAMDALLVERGFVPQPIDWDFAIINCYELTSQQLDDFDVQVAVSKAHQDEWIRNRDA